MPAKLNAFPSYIVLDITKRGTISEGGLAGAITRTGTFNDIFDKNLDTYYKVSCTLTDSTKYILFDCKDIIWNVTLFTKYKMRGMQMWFEYSIDGTNWTTITYAEEFSYPNVAVIDETKGYSTIALRYLRWRNYYGVDNDTSIQINELKIMGSV